MSAALHSFLPGGVLPLHPSTPLDSEASCSRLMTGKLVAGAGNPRLEATWPGEGSPGDIRACLSLLCAHRQ